MAVDRKLIAIALAAAVVGSVVGAAGLALVPGNAGPGPDATTDPGPDSPTPTGPTDGPAEDPEMAQFDSKADFQEYVRNARSDRGVYYAGGGGAEVSTDEAEAARGDAGGDGGDGGQPRATQTATAAATVAEGGGGDGDGDESRYSDTNVQVEGVQEPDTLKSDGNTIYYGARSRERYYDEANPGRTHVIDASAPATPKKIGAVDDYGRMFLVGDTLVVLGEDHVTGYNVSDPENPSQTWQRSLEGRIAAARMLDGQMYLVVQQGVDLSDPCPVEPLGSDGPSVPCTDVYHPRGEASADVTYTTLRMDPNGGEVSDSVSVVGTRDHSATYVSQDAVYLTYTRQSSYTDLMMTFLLEEREGLLDERARNRLRELQGYDLSDRALRYEIQATIENWMGRLDEERREEVRETLSKQFQTYLEENKRKLQTTGIVEVGIDGNMSVDATGEVPGYPIGQWALSQSGDTLRIATTVEGFGVESENDLYTLDSNLDRMGSVQGMSDGQRIYSVRYVGDTAYVVTFRQVDPFHVIDLSDPANPKQLGKVKLPGFSRYMHPLSENKILGIGEEDGKVKATVFGVSDPSNPKVLESLKIDARYSAIAETHHAFLLDRKHGVFFLPGDEGGYVVSYEDGLSVERRVDTEGPATRAMYIDNYMYVFSQNGLTVLDESDWSETSSLEFEQRERDSPPDARFVPDREGQDAVEIFHAGGEPVDGENVHLQCNEERVEIPDGEYREGERLVRTDECTSGELAMVVWTSDDGDRTVVIDRFEIPGEN